MAIASLVLGVLSIILSVCLPFISIACSLIGLPLGILDGSKSGVKVAGIITNIIGFLVALIVIILYIATSFSVDIGFY